MVNLYEADNFDKPVKEVISGKWYVTAEVETIAVIIPRIGTIVEHSGKSYQVMSTTTYQEDSGFAVRAIEYPKADITTKCQILRVDDEGEDMGEVPIWVLVDEITFI